MRSRLHLLHAAQGTRGQHARKAQEDGLVSHESFFKRQQSCPRSPVLTIFRLGNLIFIPSISVLILGLVWGGADYPWRSARVIATIVCGAAGLVLWVVVEKRYVANPTVPFEAMMKKTCVIGLLTTGLHGIVAMAVLYCWPAYFQSAKAESVIRSSIDYLPVALLISPLAMGTGISVNVLGTYKAQNIIGWGTPKPAVHLRKFALTYDTYIVIITVGVGLLALMKETTSTVGWVLMLVLTNSGSPSQGADGSPNP